MTRTSKRRPGNRDRRGAIVVFVAIMLMVFVAMAAFSVDVAYMQLSRTELRAATDASARAGAEALSRLQDSNAAVQAAIATAAQNITAGQPLILTENDVVLGSSSLQSNGSWNFTAGETPYNSIRVFGHRTSGSSFGEVSLFFGKALGVDSFAPTQISTASQLDRDICIVLDRSGSMAFDLSGIDWQYPPGLSYPDAYCEPPHPTLSRWAAAAVALGAFITELDGTDQIETLSLVTFASPGTWCGSSYNASDVEIGLTPDYSLVSNAMATRSSNPIPGGTSISSGLDDAIGVLTGSGNRPYAAKTIVLMTDGVHNYGPPPIESAQVAQAEGIVIHTVTFSDGADQQQMIAVAAATNGNHYHAPDAQALEAAFREIALTLPVVLTD
ncbi:MAG: VWA domain-containing protein [Pirellulales bacterium]